LPPAYRYELALVLNGTVLLSDWSKLEVEAFSGLSAPAGSSRVDAKAHFNYLLLSPLVLDSLQDKTEGQ